MLVIIQGSKDKFGDIEAVKNDLNGAISKDITYLSVEEADHSYRVPETKEPICEDELLGLPLVSKLSSSDTLRTNNSCSTLYLPS